MVQELPVFFFRLKADRRNYTVFDVSAKLRERGWQVPAYTLPDDLTDVAGLRIVVRNGFGRDMAELLLNDLRHATEFFEGLDRPMPDDPDHAPVSPTGSFALRGLRFVADCGVGPGAHRPDSLGRFRLWPSGRSRDCAVQRPGSGAVAPQPSVLPQPVFIPITAPIAARMPIHSELPVSHHTTKPTPLRPRCRWPDHARRRFP